MQTAAPRPSSRVRSARTPSPGVVTRLTRRLFPNRRKPETRRLGLVERREALGLHVQLVEPQFLRKFRSAEVAEDLVGLVVVERGLRRLGRLGGQLPLQR